MPVIKNSTRCWQIDSNSMALLEIKNQISHHLNGFLINNCSRAVGGLLYGLYRLMCTHGLRKAEELEC
jgi:hypothetical protein